MSGLLYTGSSRAHQRLTVTAPHAPGHRLLFLLLASGLLTTPPAVSAQVGGIRIDTQGLLHRAALSLDERAVPSASAELSAGTLTRKISLKQIERIVTASLATKTALPPDVRFLGGLTRIDAVIFDHERADVVLVGPAAGWTRLASGEVVDPATHRPVLELDDLVVALRFAMLPVDKQSFIGCSIDPTSKGVKDYTRFMKRLSGPPVPAQLKQLINGMQQAMGPQDVRLFGVPVSSRFACKLVAADYRLKRVAMGFDQVPVKGFRSYMDLLATTKRSALRTQHRFWFVSRLDGINRSPDGTVWTFRGPMLRVRTAALNRKSRPDEDDERKASPVARQLARSLTEALPQLNRHVPVFADLDNLVRLAATAELIASVPGSASNTNPPDTFWQPTLLADSRRFPLRVFTPPRTVPSLAAIRKARGRYWVFSVSGGVQIDTAPVARPTAGTVDRTLTSWHRRVRRPQKSASHWWWD